MKPKRIWKIIAAAVAVFLVLIAVGWLMIDGLAKGAVERGGTYALGVPTTVQSVDLSLIGGSLEMDTLQVANPAGYATPHMMKSGRFRLQVVPGSVLSETVRVPLLQLDGLDIHIESKGLGSNVGEILENVKKLGGEKKTAAPAEPAPAKEGGKKVAVDRVVIRNVVAHVRPPLPGAQPITVKLPAIEMNDVSSDKPISIAQLVGRLVPAILAGVLEQGEGLIPGDMLASLNTQVAGTVSALGAQATQLVQQTTEMAAARVRETIDQAGQAASEQVGRAVGDVTRQTQDTLGKTVESTLGKIKAPGAEAAADETGATTADKPKKGVGQTLEGLLKSEK